MIFNDFDEDSAVILLMLPKETRALSMTIMGSTSEQEEIFNFADSAVIDVLGVDAYDYMNNIRYKYDENTEEFVAFEEDLVEDAITDNTNETATLN